MENEMMLQVRQLKQYFKNERKDMVKAVDDISFDIYKGEIFGLIGESGCGKSTAARSIMNICPPASGEIFFDGMDISDPKIYRSNRKSINTDMQIIFQDSVSSLSPKMTVEQIIQEPLKIQKLYRDKKELAEKTEQLMQTAELEISLKNKYPYECSGGQRQRVAIARALGLDPKLIIADEPIASLDLSMQIEISRMFKKLRDDKGTTILFISHDLHMIRNICDRVAVMQKGKIVETATTNQLFHNPVHPYTKSLISSI